MKKQPNPKSPPVLLPTHYTIAEFAKIKGVARTTVYRHIKNKWIIADLVGMKQHTMIEGALYSDYQFSEVGIQNPKPDEKQKSN